MVARSWAFNDTLGPQHDEHHWPIECDRFLTTHCDAWPPVFKVQMMHCASQQWFLVPPQ